MSLKRGPLLLLAGALWLGGDGIWQARAETAPNPAGGDTVTVQADLGHARDLARRALAIGRPDLAAHIARQILQHFPKDAGAHALLTAALTRGGEAEAALPVARAGFKLAETKEARFEAAYLAAEAMAAAGRPWASKLWLRRADRFAASDQAEAVLRQAYEGLDRKTRFSFDIRTFGGPSGNVNGGSIHDTFWWGGVIPIPIAEALPGWTWGGTVSLSYRLAPRTEAKLTWSHREVELGTRARAIDPAAREDDYGQDELGLGLTQMLALPEWQSIAFLTGSAARRWSGGAHASDMGRIEAVILRPFGEKLTLGARFALEGVHNPSRPAADALTSRLGVTARLKDTRLGGFSFDLGGVQVDSDAAGIAWRGPVVSAGWTPALRSDAVELGLDLRIEHRDYWLTPSFAPDIDLNLSATAEFPDWDVMGFAPSITVNAGRTWSDVVVRDQKDLSVSLGIASTF